MGSIWGGPAGWSTGLGCEGLHSVSVLGLLGAAEAGWGAPRCPSEGQAPGVEARRQVWGRLTGAAGPGGLGAPLRRGGLEGPLSTGLRPLIFEAAVAACASGVREPVGRCKGVTGRCGG